MKWNWGTKLVLAMTAFMALVVTFGVLMMREEINLVEDDYYPKAQVHQEIITKKEHAKEFNDQIHLSKKGSDVWVQFPKEWAAENVYGKVHFYHRIHEKSDKIFQLVEPTGDQFVFGVDDLNGRYIVKLDFVYENVSYYIEKSIELP